MPATNPIVGGRHISTFAQGTGTVAEGRPAAPTQESPQTAEGTRGASIIEGGTFNVPMVTLIALALLVLFVLKWWGFRFVVSANVTGGR